MPLCKYDLRAIPVCRAAAHVSIPGEWCLTKTMQWFLMDIRCRRSPRGTEEHQRRFNKAKPFGGDRVHGRSGVKRGMLTD